MKSGLALLAGLPAVAMFFNRKSGFKKVRKRSPALGKAGLRESYLASRHPSDSLTRPLAAIMPALCL